MKPSYTPAQLTLTSLSGFVISAASLPLTRFTHTPEGIRCIPVLFVVGLFVVGMVVSIKTSNALKNGIRNQKWPEEQLEPLRSWLESSLFNVLPMMLLATYCTLWLIFPKYRIIGLAAFLLVQVLSQLRIAVRRPPGQSSSLIANWRDYLAPVHSEHWGNR